MLARLNQLFKEGYGHLEQDLNRWCYPVNTSSLSNTGTVNVPQVNMSVGASVTRSNRRNDAFTLNAPIAGSVSNLRIERSELGDMIVVRCLIGYGMAHKIVNENDYRYFAPTIWNMLRVLKEERQFGPEELSFGRFYGSFKSPGLGDVYLREVESAAAYEIRLISDCTKLPVVN